MKSHRTIVARVLRISAALFLLTPAFAAPARQSAVACSGKEIVLVVDPKASKVHWSVGSTMHTVHGTFDVKKGTLRLNPDSGDATGEVVVAGSSGESGNRSRDERMHREILETAKFPDAIFHPTEIEGKVASSGPCDVKLHGVLTVHGGDHEITALVHAELSGEQWKGTASFDVPYTSWSIKDPSNFFLKVKHTVSVELSLAGTVDKESGTARN